MGAALLTLEVYSLFGLKGETLHFPNGLRNKKDGNGEGKNVVFFGKVHFSNQYKGKGH